MKVVWVCLILPIFIGFLFFVFFNKEVEKLTLLTGPDSSIKITRDDYSIPTIYAETFEDAIFALGYAQGRDRL
jgi:Protein related to penicillin acylase